MAKYTKLKKTINRMVKRELIEKEIKYKLFELTVAEYEEAGDNPDDAKEQDLVEIAGASSL